MSPAPETSDASKRILIVDDEEIVLVALRETLKRDGYQIVTQDNPVSALEILRNQTFSVILTDQQMPQLTGLELLAQARQIQPDATRILITAVLSLNVAIDAINKGEIYRFVVKPWLREELLVTMRNAVQRYDLIRSNAALHQRTLAMNAELSAQVARVAEQNQQLDRLNQALQQNLYRSIQLSVKTLETFAPALANQARRVYELCKAMAGRLALSPDDQQILELSAWLHDIGLIGTPRTLIRKWQSNPDSLLDAERALIENHPAVGQTLANFAHNLESVGLVIRAHHERFDGSGYPDRLRQDQIPWLARLLSVAVAYATCPTEGEMAIETVRNGSGLAFDPEAVRAFTRCLPHATLPRRQQEVLVSELKPGMVIASGIYTANGVLLIPAGQTLSAPHIDKLRNHSLMSDLTQSLLVYC
jgi:response regulator RpfG family c-di-GMP phosphodiesterase